MAERVTQEVINATAVAGDWLQSCRPHIDGESPGGVGKILNQQHGQSALLCRLVFTWSTSTVYTVGAFIWANVTSLYDLILLFYLSKHVRVCHAFTGMSVSQIEITWLRKSSRTLSSLLPRKNMRINDIDLRRMCFCLFVWCVCIYVCQFFVCLFFIWIPI